MKVISDVGLIIEASLISVEVAPAIVAPASVNKYTASPVTNSFNNEVSLCIIPGCPDVPASNVMAPSSSNIISSGSLATSYIRISFDGTEFIDTVEEISIAVPPESNR